MILRPSTVGGDVTPGGLSVVMWQSAVVDREVAEEVRLSRWWNQIHPLRWLGSLLNAFGRLLLRHLGTGRYDPGEHQ